MICLALVLIMGFLLFYTYTGDGRKNEHEGIIRLHVIANSDTVGDQALKLKVRDAVIEYLQKQDDLHTVDDTREYLEANLGSLEKISEGIIAANGRDYSAHAKLGVRYIPEKTYGDITFPAGNYEALNITLGDGKGENWWCVLFPRSVFSMKAPKATLLGMMQMMHRLQSLQVWTRAAETAQLTLPAAPTV